MSLAPDDAREAARYALQLRGHAEGPIFGQQGFLRVEWRDGAMSGSVGSGRRLSACRDGGNSQSVLSWSSSAAMASASLTSSGAASKTATPSMSASIAAGL